VRFGLAVILVISAACQPAPRELGQFTIRPVPPSLSTGTGKAATNGAGDLVISVSVHGPAAEVTRTGRDGQLEPNLIWHLVEGDCASWRASGTAHNVLIRWTSEPRRADADEFEYTISRSFLGELDRPHAIAAFRNGGGGPLYACGDLPPLAV
jgi:hypothetical protein